MKHKTYKFSILTLVAVLLLALTAFFSINFINAEAAGTVTVSGTNVFTSTGDANVIAHKETVKEDDKDVDKFYTMFTFASEDDGVSYRRNLAYNWYEVKDGEHETEGNNKLFNMEIGFEDISFEKFVITFESQQYNKTKDGKSKNYVMFFTDPAYTDKIYALITADEDATVETAQKDGALIAYNKITVKFNEKRTGAYSVSVGDGNADTTADFENVGGNFAKSSTSSSSPVYPLIFNATFSGEEGTDADKQAAKMVLYSLNGQNFELKNTSHDTANDYYYGGTVTDSKPAVLCLNENFRFFELGEELDINYTVIDVLRSSPSSEVHYYVLDAKQYKDDKLDYNDKELFKKAEDDILLESDVNTYLPLKKDLTDTAFTAYNEKGKLTADMLVKVYVHLKDISSNSEETDVYLDWYVDEYYKVKVGGADFLAVAKDKQGVTYNYDGIEIENSDGASTTKKWGSVDELGTILGDYQEKVNKAAANLSAGSSSYLYLPSVEELFSDNATAYTDMKFSIYYYHDAQQSNTGNSSSNLSINVTKQGAYTFTVYATDAAGNNMYYMDGGEVKEFASSEIWTMYNDKDEDGLYEKLPWFTFNVSYTGVAFEETPGLQSTAYVGTSYGSASFKINGISGSYDTKYRLFIFDRAAYYHEKNETYSYEEFVKDMDKLFENDRKYFKEIPVVTEADANYEEFKDYEWSGTSTTFVPQDANAFYMIRAEVTDKQYNTDPVTCSLAVVASVNAKTIKGESDWLKNNVASVVLLSVAGLALVGIVLLLLIKPKDKGDIEEQYENIRKKEKKNKQ